MLYHLYDCVFCTAFPISINPPVTGHPHNTNMTTRSIFESQPKKVFAVVVDVVVVVVVVVVIVFVIVVVVVHC